MNINTQKAAAWFSWIVIVVGIAGFIPGVVNEQGFLLGIFQVNALLNLVYILIGLIGIFSARSLAGAKLFFKISGVVYLLMAILTLAHVTVATALAVNTATVVLHVVLALVALYYGFRQEGAVAM